MRLYINAETWDIWSQPTRSPILQLTFQRGAMQPIEVRFVEDAAVLQLGNGATGTLSFFTDPSSATLLCPAVTWVATGTGTSAVYTFLPFMSGMNLDLALALSVSIAAYMQIKWTDGTTIGKTPLLGVRIYNSYA